MKLKNLLITLVGLLFFTGCGGQDITLDLEKVEIELNSLEIVEDGEKTKLFENSTKLETDAIQGRGIDVNLFEEILFSMNTTSNEFDMYLVYLPKSGNEELCEEQIDDYLDSMEDNIALYNPEEAEKIENRLEEVYGNYYIYIVSKDNEKTLEKIKNTK